MEDIPAPTGAGSSHMSAGQENCALEGCFGVVRLNSACGFWREMTASFSISLLLKRVTKATAGVGIEMRSQVQYQAVSSTKGSPGYLLSTKNAVMTFNMMQTAMSTTITK
jgi:hypothetical protein